VPSIDGGGIRSLVSSTTIANPYRHLKFDMPVLCGMQELDRLCARIADYFNVIRTGRAPARWSRRFATRLRTSGHSTPRTSASFNSTTAPKSSNIESMMPV
jgi:hypothetical protein